MPLTERVPTACRPELRRCAPRDPSDARSERGRTPAHGLPTATDTCDPERMNTSGILRESVLASGDDAMGTLILTWVIVDLVAVAIVVLAVVTRKRR